jgi:secondary thiamine-phosphate synthase enzyme
MVMPASVNAAAYGVVRHILITVETHGAIDFVDLTERLQHEVASAGVVDGVAMVQCRHTTAGILINEHEPLLLEDLEAMFKRLVPTWLTYGHDDFLRRTVNLTARERINGHAHCRAALLRTSECLAIHDGALTLGRWQRIFLVDFDAGQPREVWLTLMGGATVPDGS